MKLLLLVGAISVADLWGWIGVALLIAVIAIPYKRIREIKSASAKRPGLRLSLRSMWMHYWLAPAAALISLLHAWIPMSSGRMPNTSLNGLWLATYALGLLFLQLLVGLITRYAGPNSVVYLRRIHFAIMAAIMLLLASHLILNS